LTIVVDLVQMDMKEISASKFKATCLSLLDEVNKTRTPIRVTKFGKPIAELRPLPAPTKSRKNWLGRMEGTIEILGDIVGPSTDPEEWDALR
jgi:prevent-host-death family protein